MSHPRVIAAASLDAAVGLTKLRVFEKAWRISVHLDRSFRKRVTGRSGKARPPVSVDRHRASRAYQRAFRAERPTRELASTDQSVPRYAVNNTSANHWLWSVQIACTESAADWAMR